MSARDESASNKVKSFRKEIKSWEEIGSCALSLNKELLSRKYYATISLKWMQPYILYFACTEMTNYAESK